jgi:phage terminase large subunit-like protein
VSLPENPVLFGGVDIGYRNDTAAVTFSFRDPRNGRYGIFDYQCWDPAMSGGEVHLKSVTDALLRVIDNHHVAKLLFDPFQFIQGKQELEAKGHGHILEECNQQAANPAFCTNLKVLLTEGVVDWYPTDDIRNHFKYAAVRATERGWRIEKKVQSRPIDLVISTGMSLWACVESSGSFASGNYAESRHSRTVRELV